MTFPEGMNNMRTIEAVFQTGLAFTRSQLSRIANKDDRTVRENIRLLRRAGVPIVALKDGGYKLAETPEAKAQLLNMYRTRALDELTTYSRLLKAMQCDGQITVEELMTEVEV